MEMPSKVFGPTDSVSDTYTQIGNTYNMPPQEEQKQVSKWYIYQLLIAKGNVVNAKENSGHVVVETTNRSYQFAYGNGIGGATNSHTSCAEMIECAIPVLPNSQVKIYVLDAQVAKDVTVSMQFSSRDLCVIGKLKPNPDNFRTLAGGGISANADTAADTEESFTVNSKLIRATLQPEINGRIYQIRVAGTGVVDAKAGSGKISVLVPSQAGPYEYAIGNGAGGATLGGVGYTDVINIPEGIPVSVNSTIDIKITTAEVMKTPTVSCNYW